VALRLLFGAHGALYGAENFKTMRELAMELE
jgi:hypothetical protein